MVTTPPGPGDQRYTDIKVHNDDTTWLVDVGVVCPSTRRLVERGTDLTQGLAAAAYNDIKAAKYSDQSNFVLHRQDGREGQRRRAGVLRQGLRRAGGGHRAGSGG
jgi:hypothetical protein